MPERVRFNRVIPCLIRELVNHDMVPFVLPNLLLIMESVDSDQFKRHLEKQLIPVFSIDSPIQVPLIIFSKMELLINKSKSSPDFIRDCILSLMSRSLDLRLPDSVTTPQLISQLNEMCLKTIPLVGQLIDSLAIKKTLLPKIKKLCLGTSSLSIKVNCLVTIGKILEHLGECEI